MRQPSRNIGQELLPGVREFQPSWQSTEELDSQMRLKRFDMMAYGGGSHTQFVGSRHKPAKPGGNLKDPKRI